jgi:hypothetical protein
MKNSRMMLLSAVLVVAAAASANAQATHQATQTVDITISAVNRISVGAGTPTLTINTAVAGDAPTDATASSSWSITTNQTGTKVTAKINSAMPSGASLLVTLAAPAGATSIPTVNLDASDKDVVTGITQLNAAGLGLSYTLQATSAASATTVSKTVTYTVVGGV